MDARSVFGMGWDGVGVGWRGLVVVGLTTWGPGVVEFSSFHLQMLSSRSLTTSLSILLVIILCLLSLCNLSHRPNHLPFVLWLVSSQPLTISKRYSISLYIQVVVELLVTSTEWRLLCLSEPSWTAPITLVPRTCTSLPSSASRVVLIDCLLPVSVTWSWPLSRRESLIWERRVK